MKYLIIEKVTSNEVKGITWKIRNKNYFNSDIRPSFCRNYNKTIVPKIEKALIKGDSFNHNKHKFYLQKSVFTKNNKPIYYIIEVGSEEPWIFYSINYKGEGEVRPYIGIDENLKLFNKYKYIEKRI